MGLLCHTFYGGFEAPPLFCAASLQFSNLLSSCLCLLVSTQMSSLFSIIYISLISSISLCSSSDISCLHSNFFLLCSLLCRIVEAVCIGWFTAECVVRFLVARNKWDFLRRPLNIIDVIAITPYYVTMALARAGMPGAGLGVAGVILRVLRMMRVFWLMKLARHFLGLQTLGLTLTRCYREMVMLMVFVCVAMAIYSALAQLLEHGLDLGTQNPDYASIPAAAWWVIISMTTVGYGDVYPVTVGGRVLGGMCVVSGIVLLALPITFIYHSFVQCYHELKLRSARCARSLAPDILKWTGIHGSRQKLNKPVDPLLPLWNNEPPPERNSTNQWLCWSLCEIMVNSVPCPVSCLSCTWFYLVAPVPACCADDQSSNQHALHGQKNRKYTNNYLLNTHRRSLTSGFCLHCIPMVTTLAETAAFSFFVWYIECSVCASLRVCLSGCQPFTLSKPCTQMVQVTQDWCVT